MFRNLFYKFSRDQKVLRGSSLQPAMNFSTCVHYSDLWLCYHPGSDKCAQILSLVCTWLDHMCSCIQQLLLLRLNTVTSRLLQTKPVRRNAFDHLPDILHDVHTANMVRIEPDVLPLFSRTSNIRHQYRSRCSIYATVPEPNCVPTTDSHENRYCLSHLCHCDRSIHCHQSSHGYAHDAAATSHVSRCRITSSNNVTQVKVTITRYESNGAPSQADNDFPSQAHDVNRRIVYQRFCSRGVNRNNAPDYEQTVSISQRQQSQSWPEASLRNHLGVANRTATAIPAMQHRSELVKPDSEIAKDIVLTLRRVGDSIDSRLRVENKQSLFAVLKTTKISACWFMMTTRRQRSVTGAIVYISIGLLQQLSRL